ncbi:MAG: pyridoxamine 5-phosphate oxidase-related FMN-binding protein [Verrucomicrobiaceae bacterium]|nr:pyridoxamine 5-phosphate oxidase-related FMN-binding protein [Verrucomicrobiaceae bacterium]
MPNASPINLQEDLASLVNVAIDSGNIMVLAVVDKNHRPLLSFRGSTAVFSADQLSLWARNAHGNTIESIANNPHVAMMYRSQAVPMLEFSGRARIATDAAERNKVFELAHAKEQASDPERKGVAIIIDVDKVSGVLGFNADGPIWCLMER